MQQPLKERNIAERREVRFYTSSEQQEKARLREGLERTNEEKFSFLMNLMKMGREFKKGTIKHK